MRTESIAPLEVHNRFLVVLFIGLSLYQLFIIPIFILNKSLSLALSLLPLIFLNNTFWSLIHEGIHSKLSANIKANDFQSRLLSICYGSPFRALQLAHLLHHKYNRTPLERNEIYDPSTLSATRAKISFYFRLLFGVYLQELFIPLVTLLPRKTIQNIVAKFPVNSYNRIAVETFLKKERNLSETRFDLLCILILFCLSFYFYGHSWLLLVVLLIARSLFISFLDYSYHYGTKTDDTSFALNLALPNSLSKFILHFNYHGTHHRNPLTPWHALPSVFKSENGEFEADFFKSAARQIRGPIPIAKALATLSSNEIACERIRTLINKMYSEGDFKTEELQEALQFKGLFLFSKEKQLCIASELCNYMHTDADFEMALSYVGKKSLILKFALHSFRRQKVVTDLFECVKSNQEFSDHVKGAFGIQSQFHDQTLRSAITMQKLSRRDAIFCCYNGTALNKAIDNQHLTLPISFQTKDDIYVRKQSDVLEGKESGVRYESIYTVNHGDTQFKMKVSNAIELWRATTFSEKEPETVEWLADTITPESVFYDIGSNVGIYSLFALSIHPNCQAVCFEPDALNFARLTENLYLNNFGRRSIAFAIGLSDETKLTRFHSSRFIVGKAENWCGDLNVRGDTSEKAAVVTGCPLFTLDRFLADQPDLPFPTHLKIDVDGPEVKILKGAATTLRNPKLKHILVELFEDEETEVTELLSSFGFKKIIMKSHTPIPGPRGHMGNFIFRRA